MSTTVSSTTTNPYAVGYSSNDLAGTDTTSSKYSSTSGTSKSGSSSSSSSYSQSLVSQMSGIDVNSMVNESMASDVIKLNSLLAKQQQSQWMQDRYRSIITNLQSFSSKYFDVLSSDYVLSPNSFSVNAATSSNTNALSVSSLNTAKTGNYTVTSATLATVASIGSSALKNTNGKTASASDAISTMGVKDGTISFSINGKAMSYDLKSSSSIGSVMQDLTSLTGLNFNYSELTGKFSISTQSTGKDQNVNIQNVSDGADFFSSFGITTSSGTVATANTARIDGSGVIKSTAAAASDKISDTSLKLTNGDILSFQVDGVTKTYTVDTSKSVTTLMSDLTSLTGDTFSYNASTGNITAKAATGKSVNISYSDGSSAQAFFNDAFGMTAGTTNIKSADGSTSVTGSSIVENPTKDSVASASTAISATNLGLINGSTLTFDFNGKSLSYTVDTSKSIGSLMSDLSSLTGSLFSYDASTGKISALETGSTAMSISYADGSEAQSFFNNAFGLAAGTTSVSQTSSGTSTGTAGTDGTFKIMEPGDTEATEITNSSNKFTIDGVAYNFTSNIADGSPVTINVNQDVSSVVDKIQSFVNAYNNLIDGIQSVTNEKKDYSYSPLTSSQESQMTDSQITAWNQKAQQGLLANDSELTGMLSAMRSAFYTPVSGNGLTMASVGLSTSDDPTQGGKLTLDVKKLTTALQNNPQQVVSLFTQTSSSYPSYTGVLGLDTTTDSQAVSKAMTQRNSEEGIFQRLSDIEQKYAGTYVDKNGNQGLLLTKAGMPNTLSETKNTLYNELKNEAQAVTDFKTKMTNDAKMYNTKFSTLQSILSQLSSQQSYLSSMLSSSSS